MKLLTYTFLFASLSIISCTEHVEGPAGPPGVDGLDGEEAYTFDYEVDFTAPDYSVLIDFPSNFHMLSSDVVLVYLLWNVQNGKDVWRLLPQTLLTNNGLFQYNFDFTVDNVSIFLESEFPFSSMGSDYLLDQVFRIVVIPGQFFQNARHNLDFSDYEAVAKTFKLRKLIVNY